MHFPRLALAASAAVLVAGCAVGPDFEHPAKPGVASYDSDALPAATDSAAGASDPASGAAQKFTTGCDIPAEWWQLFHSEPLNRLVTQALQSNPDLAAQQAALRAAEENELAGEGALFPTVSGNIGGSRQKIAGAGYGGDFPGAIYTLYNASVGVSYGIDIFGGVRRQIEELEAAADIQRFELEAARLSLTANVVTAAVQEASVREQIAATQKIVGEEEKQYDLLQHQFTLGGVAKSAVLAQQTLLEQTRATLPPLEKQLAQTRHELSALVGKFPSEDLGAQFDLASLALPATLPVTLPSNLVEQRPDIGAADANLHAASAAIGVAIANRLPQITLSADIGDEANMLSKLFSPGTGIWSLGFNAAQTIFDAGTLEHEQGVAEAQFDQAAALYRKTVLGAFQNVADALRALQSDATALKAQVTAEHAAADSLKLADAQFHDGAISYIALLDAERAEQQAKLAEVQAEALRYADTAALFEALGGGWWNRKPPADAPAPVAESSSTLTAENR